MASARAKTYAQPGTIEDLVILTPFLYMLKAYRVIRNFSWTSQCNGRIQIHLHREAPPETEGTDRTVLELELPTRRIMAKVIIIARDLLHAKHIASFGTDVLRLRLVLGRPEDEESDDTDGAATEDLVWYSSSDDNRSSRFSKDSKASTKMLQNFQNM